MQAQVAVICWVNPRVKDGNSSGSETVLGWFLWHWWDESFLPFPALRKEFIRGYLLQAAWLLLRNVFTGEDFCFVVLSCCQLPGIENNDPECELMHLFW